ncbi:MAG: hypothetical protein M1819_005383 [Sarea resinae]|nr:MAG: hypothetical protein M1819_005383 [Sarea resinae]
MLEIFCTGNPREVGRQHGRFAREQIRKSLAFYAGYFERKSKMDWPAAVKSAELFLPILEADWPDLVEEMKGVAEGASLPFSSIMALNARSEISMGMMSDGCTSLAWRTAGFSIIAQNWDWEDAQQDNLIALHIQRASKPSISQITEAGIIGKIGINSAGVGVCLNAIRARGVRFTSLPAHLALRVALDSSTRAEAVSALEKAGVATAFNILVADATGATSLECSAVDLIKLDMDNGRIAHSNHFLAEHADNAVDTIFMKDSYSRMDRVAKLINDAASAGPSPSARTAMIRVEQILKDEDGFPTSISRKSSPGNPSSTLFSIVTDLCSRVAVVKIGRPQSSKNVLVLSPSLL